MTQPSTMQVTDEPERLPPGTFHLFRKIEGSQVLELDPTPSTDPNEPLNWSTARKALNFGLTAAVTVVVFTALSIQLLFWAPMVVDMGLTYDQLNVAVSTNNAGLAIGCIFFIPFAKKYGHRPVYVVSTAVMAGMAFWSANMKTATELYISQLCTGLAGAINETIVQMTIADLFFVHHRGSMNAIYMTAVMSGSFLTSIPAGVQAVNQSWRWSYQTLAIVNTFLFLCFLFLYEETKYIPLSTGRTPILSEDLSNQKYGRAGSLHSSSTQHRGDSDSIGCAEVIEDGPRAQIEHDSKQTKTGVEIRQLTTNTSEASPNANIPTILHSYRHRMRWTTTTDESYLQMIYQPLIVLISFPHIIFTALQYASGVAWLVITASILARTYTMPPYNFSPAGIGYMSLGPFVGNTLGSIYGGVLGDWIIKWLSRRNKGYFEPEFRLYLLPLAAVFLSGGLIMFGATTDRGMHWIYPSIGGAFFGFGLGAIGDASLTLVIDAYREITGDAFVGIAFIRNVFGIAVPFGITPWLEVSTLTNIFIVCGFVSLAISCLFIPMIVYGKRIRTRYAGKYQSLIEKQGHAKP